MTPYQEERLRLFDNKYPPYLYHYAYLIHTERGQGILNALLVDSSSQSLALDRAMEVLELLPPPTGELLSLVREVQELSLSIGATKASETPDAAPIERGIIYQAWHEDCWVDVGELGLTDIRPGPMVSVFTGFNRKEAERKRDYYFTYPPTRREPYLKDHLLYITLSYGYRKQ